MSRSARVARDWLLVAAAVLFIGYILASPTGSFVTPQAATPKIAADGAWVFFSSNAVGLPGASERDRVE